MIKRLTTVLTGMLLLGSATAPTLAQESATNEQSVVYIIPIKEMIERGLLHFVRRGVMEADADGAVAIILDMDTPGGRLDATEEIIEILTSTPATTYTFVNSDAISAGAITAMATDHIYMTPRSRIGDAMPIMMSPLPMGGPQQMPEDLKEKMVSPTVAMIRAAAQLKGHDDKLAEAMVRAEFEYKIGEKMICPEGQLLTLTDQDAAQLVGEGEDERPLLSAGTFDDIPALLEELGLGDSRVVVVKTTTGERVARVIEGFPMSGILMALGLLFLYIEFKTPGFGLPGIAGILLLAVWFWGHHVAGLANFAEVLLFAIGIVLLLAEIFITPGFGILGTAGLTCIVVGLFMSMVEHAPSGPWYLPSFDGIREAIFNFSTAMVLTVTMGAFLGRFLPKSVVFNRLYLSASEDKSEGYSASAPLDALLGVKGQAVTQLRPAGIGEFEGKRHNVVTRGTFVDADTPIVVAEVHGNRIVVDIVSVDTASRA